jgi:hypothetical protein
VIRSNRGHLHRLSEAHFAIISDRFQCTRITCFGALFDVLFTRRRELQAKIEQLQVTTATVATHIRFGDQMFARRGSLDAKQGGVVQQRFACMERSSREILQDLTVRVSERLPRWLICSDAGFSAVSSWLPVRAMNETIRIPWEPVHINRKLYIDKSSFGDSLYRERLLETYAEWCALADAAIVVLHSLSGFSRTAVFSSLTRRGERWWRTAVIDAHSCLPYGAAGLTTLMGNEAGVR